MITDGIYTTDHVTSNNTRNDIDTADITATYFISNTSLNINTLSICYSIIDMSSSQVSEPSFNCSSLCKKGLLYINNVPKGKYQLKLLVVENIDQDTQSYLSAQSNQVNEFFEVKDLKDVFPVINLHKVNVVKEDGKSINLLKTLNVLFSISGVPTACMKVKLCIRTNYDNKNMICYQQRQYPFDSVNITVMPTYNGYNNNKTLIMEAVLKNINTDVVYENSKVVFIIYIDNNNKVHYQLKDSLSSSLSSQSSPTTSVASYIYRLSLYMLINRDNFDYLTLSFLDYYISIGIIIIIIILFPLLVLLLHRY